MVFYLWRGKIFKIMNIIITGASKGIGKAIAEVFAGDKQGHNLFLCARNKDNLDITAKELQARFPRSGIYARNFDVSIEAEVKEFGEWVIDQSGTVDILVNNAGSFIPGSVHEEEEGVLQKMLDANLMSAYHLSRLIIPVMKQQGKGHIINMGSIASLQAYKNGGAYSISKFALAGLTKNLREELKPYNIRVSGIYPGATYTDSWAASGLPRERFMEASDIAEVIYTMVHLSPSACIEDVVLRPQEGDI